MSPVRVTPLCALAGADLTACVQTFDYNGEVLPIPEAVAPLFEGCTIGGLALSSNIVYGPLTVSRRRTRLRSHRPPRVPLPRL